MSEQRGGRGHRPMVHVEPIGADLEPEPGETIIEARASFVTGVVIPVDGGWSARLA